MSRRPVPHPVSAEAVEHLRSRDPVMRGLIERVGRLETALEPDLWWSLVDAIVSQQLSVKAASTIAGRLAALGDGEGRPDPERVLALPDEALRACGLSRAKTAYVRDLAGRWLDGSLRHDGLADLDDEAVIAELTQVKGVGRWTAEMILIFTLGRPDVLPVDDVGVQIAAELAYGLPARPSRAELLALGEPWRPYRTTASLYLWRSRRIGSAAPAREV